MANTQVTNLAKLAHISLNEELEQALENTLPNILKFVADVQAIPLESIEETYRTTEEENVCREDVVEPSFTSQQALLNAPTQHDGFFVVPRVLVKE